MDISPPPPPASPPPPPQITSYFLTNTTVGVNPYLQHPKTSATTAAVATTAPASGVGIPSTNAAGGYVYAMNAPAGGWTALNAKAATGTSGATAVGGAAAAAATTPVTGLGMSGDVGMASSATLPMAAGTAGLAGTTGAPATTDQNRRHSRKVLQASPAAGSATMCTVYYRKLMFLAEVTITATAPETCGGGYCDNNTWAYSVAPPCGQAYKTVTLPISSTQYETDLESDFSWCADWPSAIPAADVPTCTAYLRSSSDPYVLAGAPPAPRPCPWRRLT